MPKLESYNPATGEKIWEGDAASVDAVHKAVDAARRAFPAWAALSLNERIACVERFRAVVEQKRDILAETISKEMGKPLWDTRGEVTGVVNKVAISVAAYQERTPQKSSTQNHIVNRLIHKPHGVMAVFGPYNFPAHLPNGHIVPALLAGNTVVFKPSEETPLVAETYVAFWKEAGLPEGVLNVVQGGRDTGIALAASDIDGILFTGSWETGKKLHEGVAGRPEILLALEMGGNNPLVVWEPKDLDITAQLIVQSAFMSSGQRCTCARRLILPGGKEGDAVLDALTALVSRIRVGAYTDNPEPFMGPLVSLKQAENLLAAQDMLRQAGGKSIVDMQPLESGKPFLTPGIIDVTGAQRSDREFFGPLLQVIRVKDFESALAEANNTKFGLAAGLISKKEDLWQQFLTQSRAGIVNWNRQTTGAASNAPFGGVGHSGNHRPSAYYAADYCAWPVASMGTPTPASETIVGVNPV
ncbi:MAG: succinylglutamate-semialdehyde dehydrogenase [Rickettsiales bacterium]